MTERIYMQFVSFICHTNEIKCKLEDYVSGYRYGNKMFARSTLQFFARLCSSEPHIENVESI